MNDVLPVFTDAFMGASAAVFRGVRFVRLETYWWNRERLRGKYRLGSEAPLRRYDGRRFSRRGSDGRSCVRVRLDEQVRLWILTVSNRTIYATNPSTIAVFLQEIHEEWNTCRRLVIKPRSLRHVQKVIASRRQRLAEKVRGERRTIADRRGVPGARRVCMLVKERDQTRVGSRLCASATHAFRA